MSGIHVLIRAPWETEPAVILASGDHFWHFAHERTGGQGEADQLASPEPGSDRLLLVPAILRNDVRRGFIILEPPVLHAVIPQIGGRRRYERFATYFERMPFTAFACWHREVARRVREMMVAGEVLAVWDESDYMRQGSWEALATEYRGRVGGRRRPAERNPFAIVRTHEP